MDTKKLMSAIKKGEKKRAAQVTRVEAAEARLAKENEALAAIDEELKPLYALRDKLEKFEKDFNDSVAELVKEEEKEAGNPA